MTSDMTGVAAAGEPLRKCEALQTFRIRRSFNFPQVASDLVGGNGRGNV